ncbi:MAG: hypothetical protein WC803_12740 [Sphingomonas sp.]|jgi:hypothetical protein
MDEIEKFWWEEAVDEEVKNIMEAEVYGTNDALKLLILKIIRKETQK